MLSEDDLRKKHDMFFMIQHFIAAIPTGKYIDEPTMLRQLSLVGKPRYREALSRPELKDNRGRVDGGYLLWLSCFDKKTKTRRGVAMNKFLSEDELKGRHNEEKQQLQREIDQKDEALKEYRKDHGKLEVFFNRVISCINPVEPLESVYRKVKKSSSEVSPVMHITDSHMGSVQASDEIEQFNIYNPDICDKRNIGFANGFVDWVQLHRTVYNIRNCNIIFTGDLISGDIHDESRVTNAFPVPNK